MDSDGIRIDRLLYFLRLAKSRSLAQNWVTAGHIRINGRRIEKPSALVIPGDNITMPRGEDIIVVELLNIPIRRGPASEAHVCFCIV
jgi:ribosome-associated heat shock protein Hsp15